MQGVFVSGNYAYLVAGAAYLSENSLLILDISDPTRPRRVGHHAVTGAGLSVSVSGHHAYVSTGWDASAGGSFTALEVFDVVNPLQPRRVGGNSSFQSNSEIFVTDENVFLATSAEGLLVLDRFRDLSELRLEALSPLTPGSFRFLLHGPQGLSGRIQRSTDLQGWTDWQPFSFGSTPLLFTDSSGSTPQNFYRAVAP
jgi:hypothetical protein